MAGLEGDRDGSPCPFLLFFPRPVPKNAQARVHTPGSVWALLRSHEDKEGRQEGIGATGKQA